ncbi:MAG: hypothetical protein ABEJ07_05700 [Candidatus Nanohaloarchaea archaeon]
MEAGETEAEPIADILVESSPGEISPGLDAGNWELPERTDSRGSTVARYDTGRESETPSPGNPDYPVTVDLYVRKGSEARVTFSPAGDDMEQYENLFEDIARVEADWQAIRIEGLETSQLDEVMAGVEQVAESYAEDVEPT